MKVEVTGKNGFVPTKPIIDYAEDKVSKMDTFFKDQDLVARVVLKVYPKYHKAEVTIPAKNLVMRSEAEDETIYGAIDKSIEKLVSQFRKYKTRVKTKDNKKGINDVFAEQAFETPKGPQLDPEVAKLVRNKEVKLEPMTVDEAMEAMELSGHDFFIYLDKMTHKVNVIYVREDGDYAVIETKE